jgi:Uma2 family endonuclease
LSGRGAIDEERDREVKRALYGRRGVLEYWTVDWQQRTLDVYRRGERAALDHGATLYA